MSIDSDLLDLIHEAKIVFDSKATWEFKYSRIFFHWSTNIKPFMNEHGMNLRWYDPDTTYEEDVRSFMGALIEFSKSLEAVESVRCGYDELCAARLKEHARKRLEVYNEQVLWEKENPDKNYYEEFANEMRGDWR